MRPNSDYEQCVFVTMPLCPHCGGRVYHALRSERQGDGSTRRKMFCDECRKRFALIVEFDEALPESGNVAEGTL